jgi:hypothetical protein
MFDTLLNLITNINTEVTKTETHSKKAQAKEPKLSMADAKYNNIVLLDNKAAISNISLAA